MAPLSADPTQLPLACLQEKNVFAIWDAHVEEMADLNLQATGSVFYGANEFL